MELEKLVKRLETDYGFKIDSNASVMRLLINKEYTIYLEENDLKSSIFIYSPFCQIPTDKDEELSFFYNILSANMFLKKTEGAVFGIDEQHKWVVLFEKVELEHLDYRLFIARLSHFVAILKAWKEKIHLSTPKQPTTQIPTKGLRA